MNIFESKSGIFFKFKKIKKSFWKMKIFGNRSGNTSFNMRTYFAYVINLDTGCAEGFYVSVKPNPYLYS